MPETDYSQYANVNFRSGGLDSKLSERATQVEDPEKKKQSKNQIAKRDLGRYYALLPGLVPTFSEDQALFLCQVFNGSRNINPERVWDEVADAVQEKQPFMFDVAGLLARLDALSIGERIALVDAIERYWSGAYHKSGEVSKSALRRVGLVK